MGMTIPGAGHAAAESNGACNGTNGSPAADGPEGAEPRLAFARISAIERLPEGERWLVEGFLSAAGIAVLASAPKAGKTWVALSLATAVASGEQALGYFHVPSPGPVLLFHAEDDPRSVRERIESLCLAQRLNLEALPIHVITAEALKLDDAAHREKLEELVAHLKPKLLILDPLVRLHSGAESYVGHVAELFGYLRTLQRRFQLAILVTHHVAKNRSGGGAQPGHAMRGSGDIHAAYDHGATLQRQQDGSIVLALEHRSAPSPDPITLRLHSRPGGGTSFELVTDEDAEPIAGANGNGSAPRVGLAPPEVPVDQQVLDVLRRSSQPLSQVAIRRALKVRNETLTATLRALEQEGAIENLGRMKGWRLKAEGDPDEVAAEA